MGELFKEIKESLNMRQVAEHFGYEVNRSGFILSPFGNEKTPSCKLYRNSYYDFSAAVGGDLVQFTAAINGTNNWQACQYLIEAFSLPYSLSDNTDNWDQIQRRERERRKKREKEKQFNEAWLSEVSRLKAWENIYQQVLGKKIFPPLSEMWAFTVVELQKVSYKLDVLCVRGSRQEREEILTESGWTL